MGYSNEDRTYFTYLHLAALIIHIVSCVFAFSLAPPAEKMKQFIYVEAATFGNTSTGEPTIYIIKKEVFKNANAIAIIAWNELFTAVSHFIALIFLWFTFTCDCCSKCGCCNEDNKKYEGRSRPEEYTRRWIEYGITAGLLEVGMLVGQGECNIIVLSSVLLANAAMQLIGFYNDYTEKNKWNIIPSISAFIIMFSIIIIFIFKAANQSSGTNNWESLNYGYLAIVFSIFYLSFGIHQTLYLNWQYYAENIDVDKIFVYLSITSKIVLSWTYIAIARGTWDEIDDKNNHRLDDKVSWEGGNVKDSIAGWNWVKYGTVTAAVLLIIFAYSYETKCCCCRKQKIFPRKKR